MNLEFQPNQILQVKNKRIKVNKFLAAGGFSTVYLCTLDSGQNVVVKNIKTTNEDVKTATLNEIEILSRFDHPNIVSFIDSFISNHQVLIIMEYCDKNLVDYMNEHYLTKLPEHQILFIFNQICSAVQYLHTTFPMMIHRDIKVENVLTNQTKTIFKLCDFGSCTFLNIEPRQSLLISEFKILNEEILKFTTKEYRPPEYCDLYLRLGISNKVDVWAMGCLLYKLCFFVFKSNQDHAF